MKPTIERIRLIVGLGNYGGFYNLTRHNCGLHFVDFLAGKFNLTLTSHKELEGDYAKIPLINDSHLGLYKPYTRINDSGVILKKMVNSLNLKQKEVLVAHDDLEQGIGRYKFVDGTRSPGGHNGLRSINKAFGGKSEIWKLKIGIGRPLTRDHATVSTYVMESFSELELEKLLESYENIYQEFIQPFVKDVI